jgi:hypothetical protein
MINLFDSITREIATKKKETNEEEIQLNNQITLALQREKIINAKPSQKKNNQRKKVNLDNNPCYNPFNKPFNPYSIDSYK